MIRKKKKKKKEMIVLIYKGKKEPFISRKCSLRKL